MGTVLINKKDEIIMKLVHYFITEENYTPIVVNGVKDEIWLESSDGPYRIIRINSNYIHNSEQYDFDIFKTKNIIKQIKKKTLSFSMHSLNIFLDINPDIEFKQEKAIDSINIKSIKDLKQENNLTINFPHIISKLKTDTKGIDLVFNVTKEINKKTAKQNKQYEMTFKSKPVILTPILIGLNILIFLLIHLGFGDAIIAYGANFGPAVQQGQIWRLLTSVFIHFDIFHIFFNMYALYIIGKQIETFLGREKFIVIYLISGITGSMLANVVSDSLGIGASGAIFGLLGALIWFGYHYRLYLGQNLKTQIIPILILNLLIGLIVPNISLSAHIGGLVGGFLTTMTLGVSGKSSNNEKVNGVIVLIIYIAFLVFMSMFMK